MRLFILCCFFLCSVSANAKEIAGVMVQETVQTEDGVLLQLNGAGIRSKFFFDIYLAELYLEHPAKEVEKVLDFTGRKRIVMHFLYEKVEKEKLVESWNEGFSKNTGADELAVLNERIEQFNALFKDAVKGDIVVLDYIPEQGTVITIDDVEKGVIRGKDFNDALLRIWLGDEPVNKGLKKKLLNYK